MYVRERMKVCVWAIILSKHQPNPMYDLVSPCGTRNNHHTWSNNWSHVLRHNYKKSDKNKTYANNPRDPTTISLT